MNASELRAYHDDRVHRSTSKDKPGFADSLTRRARDEKHGAVQLSKPELADAILAELLGELAGAANADEIEERAAGRPVLNHIVQRIVKPLAEASPDRPRRRR